MDRQAVTPYYEDESVVLYNAACEDVLPHLSDVGLVLTSPPYNLSGDGRKPSGSIFKSLATGYATYSDAMPHADYVEWPHRVVRALWGTLADDGAIFYNHKPLVRGNETRLPLELIPAEIPLRQIVTWDRGSGFTRTFMHFVPTHEWVMILAKPEFRIATRSVDDVWRIPFDSQNPHPAPFPLRLATLAIGSTAAATILDPFAGSGTTLRAAKDLGRKAIGIELDERYCEMAANRLSQEVLDIFGEASA